jgi:hypothetical protein
MRFEAKEGPEGMVSLDHSNIYSSLKALQPLKSAHSGIYETLAIGGLPRNIRISSEMNVSKETISKLESQIQRSEYFPNRWDPVEVLENR